MSQQTIEKGFASTKTYMHNVGLSCAFRQHRAKSHCRFIHGYALSVKLVFASEGLDENGWVQDFGSLKSVKKWLEDNFDHKTLVAKDDPAMETFVNMEAEGLIQLNVVPAVGCEKFAEYIFDYVISYFPKLVLVEVREHEGNSAICSRKS